jgi:hypothetical protein
VKLNLEGINLLFEKMVAEGFEISRPLRWGFFFFDRNKKTLDLLWEVLMKEGYSKGNDELMDDNYWRLFVTKDEILDPQKIHERNIYFHELARMYSVELYDGWDVEKIK